MRFVPSCNRENSNFNKCSFETNMLHRPHSGFETKIACVPNNLKNNNRMREKPPQKCAFIEEHLIECDYKCPGTKILVKQILYGPKNRDYQIALEHSE